MTLINGLNWPVQQSDLVSKLVSLRTWSNQENQNENQDHFNQRFNPLFNNYHPPIKYSKLLIITELNWMKQFKFSSIT